MKAAHLPMKSPIKWIVYGVIPLTFSVVLQAMYFSGDLVLQRLICPKLPPLSPDAYREFGLLENLQNLLLLAIILTVVIGALRAARTFPRLAFGALALASTVVFLEEIDYGTHFYAYATADAVVGWFEPAGSVPFMELLKETNFKAEPFNLHNQGGLTDIIKTIVSIIILGLFVVAPFFDRRIQNPWFRYLVPDRFVIVTVVVMVGLRFLTRYLSDWDESLIIADQASGGPSTREVGAMGNNLSEFRELITYYLFLIYLGVIVFFRIPPAQEAES